MTHRAHPLDDEEIVVTVRIEHVPTRAVVEKSIHCPCDERPNVYEAVREAERQALDGLLGMLETNGGG